MDYVCRFTPETLGHRHRGQPQARQLGRPRGSVTLTAGVYEGGGKEEGGEEAGGGG